MRYWIGDGAGAFTATVGEREERVLREVALPALGAMSADEYRRGLAALRETFAKSSVILDEDYVLFCFECDPGLIVLRVGADSQLAAVALRSPRPDFGGREPLPDDPPFDDDELDPLYNLVFTPWDAQFDAELRAYEGFAAASDSDSAQYERAMATLGSAADSFGPAGPFQARLRQLADWSGVGVRLPAEFLS